MENNKFLLRDVVKLTVCRFIIYVNMRKLNLKETHVFWGPYYSSVSTRGPIALRNANIVKTTSMAISEQGPTSAPLYRS